VIPTTIESELTAPADDRARQSTEDAGAVPEGVLVVRPNVPFYLIHYADHPGNWDVGIISQVWVDGEGSEVVEGTDDARTTVPESDIGSWWLPTMQRDPVQPGVNGHRTIKKGDKARQAYSQAHELITNDGGVILPLALGYRVEMDCVHPISKARGTFYTDAWSEPRAKIRGRRVKTNFDRNRYNRWRLMLMREGYIAPPDQQLLRINVDRLNVRIARRESLRDLPDERREVYVAEATKVAASAIAAVVPDPDVRRPAPKAKPQLSAKAPAVRKRASKTDPEPE
jgi:hypothetical protein